MKKFFALFPLLMIIWTPVLFAKESNNSTNYAANLYLDLVKKVVTDTIYRERIDNIESGAAPLCYDLGNALTMLNLPRLNHLQYCMEEVLENNVAGDFIETGVWKGGCTIFMRAFLKAYNDTSRTVWVADSFMGLPAPNLEKYPIDGSLVNLTAGFAVALDEVKANFRRFSLLDEQVKFLPGYFSETLPKAPIEKIAILRLDGDMYESTMDALTNLYPKLSKSGYIIVDDYFSFPTCMHAIEDYRRANNITDQIFPIDWTAVYWKKRSE